MRWLVLILLGFGMVAVARWIDPLYGLQFWVVALSLVVANVCGWVEGVSDRKPH